MASEINKIGSVKIRKDADISVTFWRDFGMKNFLKMNITQDFYNIFFLILVKIKLIKVTDVLVILMGSLIMSTI